MVGYRSKGVKNFTAFLLNISPPSLVLTRECQIREVCKPQQLTAALKADRTGDLLC